MSVCLEGRLHKWTNYVSGKRPEQQCELYCTYSLKDAIRLYIFKYFRSFLSTGWQPRWFVLEDGVLSYYLSAEEVQQGCRGSLNVASCDIIGEWIERESLF